MGEVYWAQYRYDGGWLAVSGAGAVRAGTSRRSRCDGLAACGNGFAAYPDAFAGKAFAAGATRHAAARARLAVLGVARWPPGRRCRPTRPSRSTCATRSPTPAPSARRSTRPRRAPDGGIAQAAVARRAGTASRWWWPTSTRWCARMQRVSRIRGAAPISSIRWPAATTPGCCASRRRRAGRLFPGDVRGRRGPPAGRGRQRRAPGQRPGAASCWTGIAARARAMGMESMLLEVRPSNERALQVYERYGLRRSGAARGIIRPMREARGRDRDEVCTMNIAGPRGRFPGRDGITPLWQLRDAPGCADAAPSEAGALPRCCEAAMRSGRRGAARELAQRLPLRHACCRRRRAAAPPRDPAWGTASAAAGRAVGVGLAPVPPEDLAWDDAALPADATPEEIARWTGTSWGWRSPPAAAAAPAATAARRCRARARRRRAGWWRPAPAPRRRKGAHRRWPAIRQAARQHAGRGRAVARARCLHHQPDQVPSDHRRRRRARAHAEEAAACRPYLERELALTGAGTVLTLGQIAANGLLGRRWRNRWPACAAGACRCRRAGAGGDPASGRAAAARRRQGAGLGRPVPGARRGAAGGRRCATRLTTTSPCFERRWGHLRRARVRALAWLLDAPDLLDIHDPHWQGRIATLGPMTPESSAGWPSWTDPAPLDAALGPRVTPASACTPKS
jgi:hypothetical protein